MVLRPAHGTVEDLSVDLSFDFDTLDGWAQTAADLTQLDVKAGAYLTLFFYSIHRNVKLLQRQVSLEVVSSVHRLC